MEIDSDPRGASILVDGQDRRKVTPDTVHGLSGLHEFSVRRDSAGASYGYRVQLRVARDSVVQINGPLTLPRCAEQCPLFREHTASRVRFSRVPAGPLFYRDGTGDGAHWPNTTNNSYVSTGIPLFAALLDGQAPIALGIYDYNFLAGRPFPSVSPTSNPFTLRQSFWVLPTLALLNAPTMRGLEVSEEVLAGTVDDVVVVRVVFRNITTRPAYQAADPFSVPDGFQFQDAFVGFALDPDIGAAEDDLFTYDPELNAIIAYDGAFREDGFQSGAQAAPALVGLRLLEAPAGTRRILNGWPRVIGGLSGDWSAGTSSEQNGWHILSGSTSYTPDHAENTIGYLTGSAINDQRIAVSAGPLNLAPGDSAVIRIAVAFAEPAAGTFTSGTVVDSGDPGAATRTIMLVAAALRAKLRAVQ
ncbi:MAG: hypothetical protein ACRERX_22580 [Pseudomonas sp.]